MPEVPVVSDAESLSARVARAFAPGGPLATAVDGFEVRPSQRMLAERIASTFDQGGTLVAEAGTGTGKTLAYLLPAVLSGAPVLISTGTRALQDQVFYKDLPALASALDRPIRAAYMKGRTNYLCRQRFERLRDAADSLGPEERDWLDRISAWAAETPTGDRAEVEDLPDDLPLWSEMTATSEQCLGRNCSAFESCFVTRMREDAAAADLVIVNHHLLCADAAVRDGEFGAVIPETDALVVDEAHQLEDVVTQHFGVSLTTGRLEEFGREGLRAIEEVPRSASTAACLLALRAVNDAASALFDELRQPLDARAGSRSMLTGEDAVALRHAATSMDRALTEWLNGLAAVQDAPETWAALRTRAERLRRDLQLVASAEDGRYVYFVEQRRRSVAIRAAPIDASAIIRESILGRRQIAVFTSATLAVGGSFAYALGRLGVPTADTLQVPAEFDYRRQAVLYLPADMPDPRSADFNVAAAAEIRALLTHSRGRAFVLFTSYSAMREVYQRLDGRVEWPLLMQGLASHRALLREFRSTPHAVLLATASFWQGVDVPGEALSCVIVDRLPFGSPTDPLTAARMAAIHAGGGQPFYDYQVPVAVLQLLQGVGRLIRTKSDRGVLAILDPRLRRMPYGQRFLRSMPDAPITDDLEVIRQFFT